MFVNTKIHNDSLAHLREKTTNEMGIQRVATEIDSMPLKMATNTDCFRVSTMVGLMHEVNALVYVTGNIEVLSFNYCSRTCKRVAHELLLLVVGSVNILCSHGTLHQKNLLLYSCGTLHQKNLLL